MPRAPTVLRGGCGPANAASGPYAGAPERLLKSPSKPAQPRLLPMPLDKSLLAPATFPRQVPEPAPWSFTRRFGGATDSSHAENTRTPFQLPIPQKTSLLRSRHIHQFLNIILDPHLRFKHMGSHCGFYRCDTEPSYHMQNDPLAFLNLPFSFDMQVDFVTANLFDGRASPGTLPQLARHAPAQQATPPASPESHPEQQRFAGNRRRFRAKGPRQLRGFEAKGKETRKILRRSTNYLSRMAPEQYRRRIAAV